VRRIGRVNVAAAVALMVGGVGVAAGDTTEQRLARLEARLAEMQQRLDAQSSTIKAHEETIAEQKQQLEGMPMRLKKLEEEGEPVEGVAPGVEIGGVVEVAATHHSPYEGDDENDVSLATFELGVSAQITDWVEAGGSLLYEEDATDLEVDTAYITIANAEVSPLFLTAGQIYLPFGAYETHLVSDPLTLEIGEARETAVQAGFVSGDFGGSLYVFNGTNKKDGKNRVGAWGVNLGFARESDDHAWSMGLGYLSDLGDSDSLQEVIADNRGDNDIANRVAGWTAHAGAQFGPFGLIGEYLSASDGFDAGDVPWRGGGARPSAFNLEAGYGFSLMGMDSVVAVAYQGSRQALALELPRERWLVGLTIEILESTALSLEWAHDKDYGEGDGGTGEDADTVTAQLAVEF
jgi:uncharacterized coiled-coil protein SlyX